MRNSNLFGTSMKLFPYPSILSPGGHYFWYPWNYIFINNCFITWQCPNPITLNVWSINCFLGLPVPFLTLFPSVQLHHNCCILPPGLSAPSFCCLMFSKPMSLSLTPVPHIDKLWKNVWNLVFMWNTHFEGPWSWKNTFLKNGLCMFVYLHMCIWKWYQGLD